MKDVVYLVMPAYNEADNIQTVISQWHAVCERINAEGNTARLVIANDGSKDDTFRIMEQLQPQYPCLLPIDKPNSGHGATVLYLYRYAIGHGADFVFQTDSDGQTLPEEFWQMWEHRQRLVVWLMFHVWVRDANTPFRLMSVPRLKEVLKYIPDDFFLANVAVSAIAVKRKERIAWYPITFRPRQGGVNSINMQRIFRIGIHALHDFRTINKSLQ